MTATAASNNNAALADQYWTTGDEIHDTKANHDLPIEKIWTDRQFTSRLVNPANRRKMTVIIVGTGLAGGAAAATLGEAGYRVENFCYQDSPRRAHSIAAQGGINAAKNYKNDGDSIYRLFYDTVKGGDYRSRETNVYRLAAVSANIIDQCVAQGVPFAREYGGLLDNRSFGGVQVQRTFYARGQTGQQLLIGAYQALERQVHAGTVHMHTRHEMVELIVADGRARGIVTPIERPNHSSHSRASRATASRSQARSSRVTNPSMWPTNCSTRAQGRSAGVGADTSARRQVPNTCK